MPHDIMLRWEARASANINFDLLVSTYKKMKLFLVLWYFDTLMILIII